MHILQTLINGTLIPAPDASLHIDDLSIVRGYGIFDYFKTVNGKLLFWEDNLDRFFHSAAIMDLPVLYTRDELKDQITKLMHINKLPNSGIKMLLTGGYSSDGYSISQPNLIITQHPLTRDFRKEQEGIKLISYNYHRPISAAKTTDYVMGIQAMKKAKKANADDVIYVQNGLLSECPRANIILITQEGTLISPEKDVLSGITRKHILESARDVFRIERRDVTIEEMKSAAEAFITSTTKNITPVLSIDDTVYGSEPGPLTRQLQEMWEKIVY